MSIFTLLASLDPLRGFPATWLVLGAAFLAIVLWDVRMTLPALGIHYLTAGLLFVDVLDPRLAVVYVLAGIIVTVILLVTAAQVNWGRPPVDLTEAERDRLRLERRYRLGPLRLTLRIIVRAVLSVVVLVGVWWLVRSEGLGSPAPAQIYLDAAIYGLSGLGLVGLSTSPEPLRSGLGVLLLLTGFELSNARNAPSIELVVALVGVNLLVAVVIAYLAQARYLPAELRE